MAKLVCATDDYGWREMTLGKSVVVGRADESDVVVDHPSVSRRHARIASDFHSHILEDLDSSNGTAVNGRTVKSCLLMDGDTVQFGDCEFRFVVSDRPAAGIEMARPRQGAATIVDSVDLQRTSPASGGALTAARAREMSLQMQALQQLAEAACGADSIEALLRRIMSELLKIFPDAAHVHAVLFAVGDAGADLCLSSSRAEGVQAGVEMSDTLRDLATTKRKAVLATDASEDSRFAAAQSIVGESLRSMMCCPLIVRERVLGAMQIDSVDPERPFTNADLQVFAAVTRQAALAAEGARLQKELVSQQRLAAVGETVAGLAHCIKNVLNGLKGGAYVLDVGIRKGDSEKTATGWGMVKRNTDFMLTLTQDMLTYCRQDAAHREPVDAAALAGEVAAMVEESAAQRGVDVACESEPGLPHVLLDAVGIKRAVLNLVTNAVEACAEGGRVRVRVTRDAPAERLRIEVADDGAGMDARTRDSVFRMFFTTKGSRGTGLGLPFVQKTVQAHDGTITLESEPGHGSTFCLSLPLRTDPSETASTRGNPAAR